MESRAGSLIKSLINLSNTDCLQWEYISQINAVYCNYRNATYHLQFMNDERTQIPSYVLSVLISDQSNFPSENKVYRISADASDNKFSGLKYLFEEAMMCELSRHIGFDLPVSPSKTRLLK